ncbi:gamma-glutamyltransferase [Methylonatrum kenyense]|uniref:gamma-glutamyltransferase n=1 Tax=Methylonatrum kenyense TaxID=455253 RepID=UPI0020C14300|nr:gamma-glutamyltransferase [Methylonatrum kenyense]MCK8515355.1 gamma-glutamyltransferase [Methylonatrum kenyense]
MTHSNGPRTGRPPTRGTRGMVATPHVLASEAGQHMLRRGGSAVDAAIAANAVLCVVYPHMAGLGGDAFWLIADPRDGYRVSALNASGPAADGATIESYREQGYKEAIPPRGAAGALTVPGAVDGWWQAHQRHGTLPWDVLFADAIHYAADGFPVANSLAEWTVKDTALLREYPATAALYMPRGHAPRAGERLTSPALAESFRRLAEQGPRAGFYEGESAERICDALAGKGSPLRARDFAAFRADWVEPISVDYRGFTAYEFPPNTQGFAALQILNLMEGFDLRGFGDASADYLHHLAESVKLAFADRNAWLTDPRFLDIPLDRLLDKGYAEQRRQLIDPERAMVMEEVAPGIVPEGYSGANADPGGDTCYFCAVDDEGLAVSVIQSIYHDFGSVEIAGDTGIILQNRGSFFSLDPAHPNALAPGKRTFHTLIPAMLYREGRPYLVYGSMGGEGQPQTHAAMVSRIVDFGYDVQQAIEAPRWLMGRTWGTKVQDLALEGRISDLVVNELKRRGQPVKPVEDWNDNMGHAQAIRIDPESGLLEGGADPRGDGAAIGY